MRAADILAGSPAWPRLALWGGLAAAALALSSLSAFARDHALMINASPSLPYWAVWLTRLPKGFGSLPKCFTSSGEVGGSNRMMSPRCGTAPRVSQTAQ